MKIPLPLSLGILVLVTFAPGWTFAQASAPSSMRPPRELMRATAPVTAAAVTRLEAQRGRPYTDAELRNAVATPEFVHAYERALATFCAGPDNVRIAACLARADRATH